MNNSVFSVGKSVDEPTWAFRRHRTGWRDADAIGAELALLEYLDEQLPEAFSVPRPGRTRDGGYLAAQDGSLYSLLGWIPGTPQRPYPDGDLNAESTWLLGRGLGSIHSVTDGWTPQTTPVRWNADTLFTEAHPGLMGSDAASLRTVLSAADLELFDEVADRTSKVFDSVQDWGVIHADYILGNCTPAWSWHACAWPRPSTSGRRPKPSPPDGPPASTAARRDGGVADMRAGAGDVGGGVGEEVSDG